MLLGQFCIERKPKLWPVVVQQPPRMARDLNHRWYVDWSFSIDRVSHISHISRARTLTTLHRFVRMDAGGVSIKFTNTSVSVVEKLNQDRCDLFAQYP